MGKEGLFEMGSFDSDNWWIVLNHSTDFNFCVSMHHYIWVY